MVRTGASAYLKYGYEAPYGASTTMDKKFGLNDALSSWSLTHNRQDLPALNQVTIAEFAYGQQTGSISVDFTLSNPWIFKSLFGIPLKTGSADPYTYTYPDPSNGINKTPKSFAVEVGFDGAAGNIVRTLKGCVASSLTINTSVGGLVGCTLSANYGDEDAPSATLGTAPTQPDVVFPYTFAHARLKYGGSVVAQVQDLSITIDQGSTLLYGLNDNQAVDAYRQLLDITGSFKASLENKTVLEDMLEQISKGTSTTYSATVGGSPELEILFQKSASESITLTGTGLSPSDLTYDGVRANEPIFENVNWKIKSLVVTAKNNQSAEE